MADAEDNLYAIVLFLPKKENDNLIDLIPSSWITTKGKKVYCQYPDKKDYSKLEEWIVTLKKPEKKWEHFSVEIISYAHNLKQGKRRLKRAYTQIQVGSTDDDIPHEKSDAAPIVLNKTLLSQALSNVSDSLEVPDGSPDNSMYDDPLCIEKAATGNKYESLEKYFDKKISEILSAISSAKQSILYDIDTKIKEVKNTIAANTIEAPRDNVRDIKDKLGFVLPINTLEQFLSFEEAIAASEEKKKALTNLYRIIICGESCLRKGIKNIMTATLSKATEMEYSAFGRQIHGLGKRNFSKTETYSCMKDVLMQKFGNSEQFKAFPNILSRWLSGARDREGGRKERDKDKDGDKDKEGDKDVPV